MKIFVVGSGKLAHAILDANLFTRTHDIVKWETQYKTLNNRTIVVHAGSGRQLNECLAFCSKTKSTLIELSTGLETEKVDPDFPLLICPNSSILIVKTLRMLREFGSNFENYEITIIESHQSTKKTEPGTAYILADSLKVDRNKIISIRDPKIQENKIGIQAEFLGKHAYHKIVIQDNNDEVAIETKVLGHDSYVNGIRTIIQTCINHSLENKRYTILDLIEQRIL